MTLVGAAVQLFFLAAGSSQSNFGNKEGVVSSLVDAEKCGSKTELHELSERALTAACCGTVTEISYAAQAADNCTAIGEAFAFVDAQ